jgi:hypothetical protein
VDGLRILAALKAARDFGLDAREAADIAGRHVRFEHLVDALATALVERGAVRVPDAA